MPKPTINRLDPATAEESSLRACHSVWTSVARLDFPTVAQSSYEAFMERIAQDDPESRLHLWAAQVGEATAGVALAVYPELENTALVEINVRVAADARRQGVGSALLSRVAQDASASGRTVLRTAQVLLESAGERWARARGFAEMDRGAWQSLSVPTVDPERWAVAVPAGFRLEAWCGAAPEDLVETYAQARTAILDAPLNPDAAIRHPDWTVERVRNHEEASRVAREELRVVAAVDEKLGCIVGFTETAFSPSRPLMCYQLDTAVLVGYRGNGLGPSLKARMMRWLTAERPTITQVVTRTDASNTAMIDVNRRLGYEIDFIGISVEASVSDVLDRLRNPQVDRNA